MKDTLSTDLTARPLSTTLVTVMAAAIGLIVANLYYLQPLLHQVKGDFNISAANATNDVRRAPTTISTADAKKIATTSRRRGIRSPSGTTSARPAA